MISLTDAVAEIPKIERKEISSTLDIAKEDYIYTKRRLYHISSYLLRKEIQITAFSQKLLDNIDENDFLNKFDTYKTITGKYGAEDSELSPTLNMTNNILSYRIIKSKMYTRDAIETTKRVEEIATTLEQLDPDVFDSIIAKLDEVKSELDKA
jgi:hypothetical protein